MKNRLLLLTVIILSSLTLFGQQVADNEAGRIMKKFKEQENSRDSYVQLTMVLTDERGRERSRQLEQWTKISGGGERKQLIRFSAPADIRGTGFLSVEPAGKEARRWLYLPALRKMRRIAGSGKTDAFMGSQFSYEDLETEKLDHYQYTLTGSDETGGRPAWKIEARTTDEQTLKESAYASRLLWIDKQTFILLQAHFFDKSGILVKIYRATDIRSIADSGKFRPFQLEMENTLNGKTTRLDVKHYRLDQGLDDGLFTQRSLKRTR